MNGDPVACDYCGAVLPADGLRIKVVREPVDGHGVPDVTVIAICSEEHAAGYFADRRLPQADHTPVAAGQIQLGWTGRLGVAIASLAALAGGGLMVAGLITVGRWLWEQWT